jgi:hypothetical protein
LLKEAVDQLSPDTAKPTRAFASNVVRFIELCAPEVSCVEVGSGCVADWLRMMSKIAVRSQELLSRCFVARSAEEWIQVRGDIKVKADGMNTQRLQAALGEASEKDSEKDELARKYVEKIITEKEAEEQGLRKVWDTLMEKFVAEHREEDEVDKSTYSAFARELEQVQVPGGTGGIGVVGGGGELVSLEHRASAPTTCHVHLPDLAHGEFASCCCDGGNAQVAQ